MLLLKWNRSRCFLSLTHDLNFDAFSSNIIKDEFRSRGTLGVYSPTHAYFDIFEVLSSFDILMGLEKLSQICRDLKFVGIRVGLLALTKLLYLCTSDFVVLLMGLLSAVVCYVRC
jgi:hypothetical protein